LEGFKLKPIGIVILYDRKQGAPEELSSKFAGEFFSQVTENLLSQKLLEMGDIKEFLESKLIFYGGIKDDFDGLVYNPDSLGQIAWKVFNNHTKKEPIDDVKMLIFDGEQVPWEHTIAACVIYDNN